MLGNNRQNNINAPISIEDMIVTGISQDIPLGEFNMREADACTQDARLYAFIKKLFAHAAKKHKKNYYDAGKIKQGCENTITRLTTNEFFFFTKKPLTIVEFQHLQQRIMLLAKQPENMHVALGSFAVKTPDNKIMNVVPYIICGKNPTVRYLVKNYPSTRDPLYKINEAGKVKILPYVNVDLDDISRYCILIGKEKIPFTFDGTFECETYGGARFHSFVEICVDYIMQVAGDRMQKKLQVYEQDVRQGKGKFIPTQASHLVISNWTDLSDYALATITFADRYYGRKTPKANVPFKNFSMRADTFGTRYCITATALAPCGKLSDDLLESVRENNRALKKTNALTKEVYDAIAIVNNNPPENAQAEIGFLQAAIKDEYMLYTYACTL